MGSDEEALPDMRFEVHTCELEPRLLQRCRRERLYLWVAIDPLGLSEQLGCRLLSRRVRPAHASVSLEQAERVMVEPTEPWWDSICDALRSQDEQDSDVYFVLNAGKSPQHAPDTADTSGVGVLGSAPASAAAGSAAAAAEASVASAAGAAAGSADDLLPDDGVEELGTAHINLEELLRLGRELEHVELPVSKEDGTTVARLTVSAAVLDALRFASSRLDAAADAATLEVGVSHLTLSEQSAERRGKARGRSNVLGRACAADVTAGIAPNSEPRLARAS